MLIGNKSELALEWQVLDGTTAQLLQFRLWAAGAEIGCYTHLELLRSVCWYLRAFVNCASERFLPEMENSPPEEVLSYIFGMMLRVPVEGTKEWLKENCAQHTPDEYRQHGQLRRIFHLDDVIGAPLRDKFNVMLMNFRSGKGQRLIWRNLDTMKIGEINLPDQLFEQLATQFLALVCPGDAHKN